ncbi:HlyD family secretion protein [Nostoc sphaeroides]|nr:HlyD family efflux transporter periplasmic adaptor subunit [Nostoc sphaeroides]
MFLVGNFIAVLILSAIIKYPITVKAPGTIRPLGDLRIIQAASEGIIKKILGKENQVVQEGDVLALIDDSQLQTKKSQSKLNIQDYEMQLTQIGGQLQSLDTQQNSESQLINLTIASARVELSRNQRDYRDRQIITETEVQEALAVLELARDEMKRYHQLAKTGAISQLQIKEKEQAFKAAQARLERVRASLNPSDAQIAIATQRIAQEIAKGKTTLSILNKERKNLLQRKIEIQNQLNRERKNLQQIETEIKKTVIHAPESGTILKLNLRNLGQVVHIGESIAQIAPSHTALLIKSPIATQDISKIQICKLVRVSDCTEGKVMLRISSYPYPDYGTLKGAIRYVTPDTIISPRSEVRITQNNTPYYEVTIEPERLYLVKDNRKYFIQSGMEVTAEIFYKEETVIIFILKKARLLTDL